MKVTVRVIGVATVIVLMASLLVSCSRVEPVYWEWIENSAQRYLKEFVSITGHVISANWNTQLNKGTFVLQDRKGGTGTVEFLDMKDWRHINERVTVIGQVIRVEQGAGGAVVELIRYGGGFLAWWWIPAGIIFLALLALLIYLLVKPVPSPPTPPAVAGIPPTTPTAVAPPTTPPPTTTVRTEATQEYFGTIAVTQGGDKGRQFELKNLDMVGMIHIARDIGAPGFGLRDGTVSRDRHAAVYWDNARKKVVLLPESEPKIVGGLKKPPNPVYVTRGGEAKKIETGQEFELESGDEVRLGADVLRFELIERT